MPVTHSKPNTTSPIRQLIRLQAITNRVFSWALAIGASLSVLFFFIYPSTISILIVGMVVGIGLLMWLTWHVGTVNVAKLMILRDTRARDVSLASLGEYEFSPLSMKSVLRNSLYPALMSFTVVSLTYRALGIQIVTVQGIVDLMLRALLVLPFSLIVPAKWIIERSNIIVLKSSERLPRPLGYVEYIDNLIGFGAAVGLVQTIAQVVEAEPEKAFGLSVAIPLFIAILLVSPSLLSTALFYKFSFVKKIQRFRQTLKLADVDIHHLELECRKCRSLVRFDGRTRYCNTCGVKIV